MIGNILILRGSITILPPDRPSVTYEYLSSLVAEYLLSVLSNPSTSGPEEEISDIKANERLDLDSALAILPKTQYGLDVNVRYASRRCGLVKLNDL
jgi:ubiquitin carboxyl-terminal hydrolase MINDY-1/2